MLDVGAGCGETALFYFCHGAGKVIAVEPNPSLTPVLHRNMVRNKWDMEIISGPFQSTMLGRNFDFMKMDGEGCEAQLLNITSLPPCAVEVHSRRILDSLKTRFEVNVLPQRDNWIVQNLLEHSTWAL